MGCGQQAQHGTGRLDTGLAVGEGTVTQLPAFVSTTFCAFLLSWTRGAEKARSRLSSWRCSSSRAGAGQESRGPGYDSGSWLCLNGKGTYLVAAPGFLRPWVSDGVTQACIVSPFRLAIALGRQQFG
ncbi:unnamed protein product [Lepidochelys kempii]